MFVHVPKVGGTSLEMAFDRLTETRKPLCSRRFMDSFDRTPAVIVLVDIRCSWIVQTVLVVLRRPFIKARGSTLVKSRTGKAALMFPPFMLRIHDPPS